MQSCFSANQRYVLLAGQGNRQVLYWQHAVLLASQVLQRRIAALCTVGHAMSAAGLRRPCYALLAALTMHPTRAAACAACTSSLPWPPGGVCAGTTVPQPAMLTAADSAVACAAPAAMTSQVVKTGNMSSSLHCASLMESEAWHELESKQPPQHGLLQASVQGYTTAAPVSAADVSWVPRHHTCLWFGSNATVRLLEAVPDAPLNTLSLT